MPVKEAGARVRPERTPCPHCGHPRLVGAARPRGPDRVWFSYCPACYRVQEHVAIPEWFWRGLLSPPESPDLH
ncbi:MAG: hypothetical protein Kow0092_11090 [Deferrisomatales bacterium]